MAESEAAVHTTCPYCGVGCGIVASAQTDGTVTVKGDPDHPANFGRLCSKGSALGETTGLEDRLLYPEICGARASWDEALDLVARKFGETVAEHGPDSVAFYVSGQLLTEDYYVANKLMKGFIGSANIDTNSRLCMASSVAGHRRAFGSDTVPGTYEDLELANLILLVGSNLAWCHPVLYQRIAAAKEKRPDMKIVLIDPRRTMTADIADLHLPIRPEGDVPLFLGLLAHLADAGRFDGVYVNTHVSGLGKAVEAAHAVSMMEIEARTGLPPTALRQFFDLFAATEKTVTVYSQGVNQSASGTDKVNAIINCHLATGRIGRPGMGPFSVTGQPNAMGGREVGGLANVLAAHMEIENEAHRDIVRSFWASPAIAPKSGLKAVDMFRAVGEGRIKALWIMGTNPVVSMPDAGAVKAALKTCPFVVVSDICADTDTIRHAHVKLPAAGWGEKDGTITNSERRISRQRPFLPLPGEARPDWWQMAEVGKRMGFPDAFAWATPAEIFAEHAALSGAGNSGTRDFDISAFSNIDEAAYDALSPFQWPRPAGAPGAADARFFANGGFFTADRKARAVAIQLPATTLADAAFPLTLNTGRIRDHWHTLTRTGKSPRLSAHLAEPFCEIHPGDAARLGIGDASIVRLKSPHGDVFVRALITLRQRQGSVFVPMHWTDRFSAKARIDTLVPPVTDPHSGQPASKNTPVIVEPFAAVQYGFAVMALRPAACEADYWALARADGGWRMELAFASTVEDTGALARRLFGAPDHAQSIFYADGPRGHYRAAIFDGGRLLGALFLSPQPVAVSRLAAAAGLRASHGDPRSRFRVIAGRPGADRPDPGAIVCACLSVGVNQIAAAIRSGEALTVDSIGKLLGAGTNCGSCRVEIRGIIDENRVVAAE